MACHLKPVVQSPPPPSMCVARTLNQPPSGGTLVLTLPGLTGATSITLRATGWVDDSNGPLYYQFFWTQPPREVRPESHAAG